MGSGKTTVGRVVASKLGIPYIDLDEFIESKQAMPISEIFAEKGEIAFRKIEHISLKELLENDDSFVLALGGGTPCYANNHLMLAKSDAVTVFLKASVGTLVQRLESEKNHRPLLAHSDSDLTEFVAKHLFDRNYYYNTARYTIVTDSKSPDEVADEIIQALT